MMNQHPIVFGWDLDGMKHPENGSGQECCLGGDVLGPSALLQFMEYRLGLGYPPVPRAVRTAQYHARLKEIDDGSKFYSRSFAADPWATSSFLLSKRDQLLESGWHPNNRIECGARVAQLQELERIDLTPLAAGTSERLLELLKHFEHRKIGNFPEIILSTPVSLLPRVLLAIFSELAKQGILVKEMSMTPQCLQGDLSTLQENISKFSTGVLVGDGSFTIVESDDEVQAAEVTAAWLQANHNNNEFVIVRGTGTSILDSSCHRLGLPRIGGERSSRFRGALQVLPLAFEILWSPFNPIRLLEFLSLPNSPVPKSISYWLMEAIRIEPGLGGDAWKEAWRRASEKSSETHAERGLDQPNITRAIKKEVDESKNWLNVGRYDQSIGIPSLDAIAICRKVELLHSRKAEHHHDDLLRAAAAQANAMGRAIKESKLSMLSKVQLERIIDDAFEDGVSVPGGGAEAAPWAVVDRPGQIWGHAKNVLWWGFAGGEERGSKQFWTQQEIDGFRQFGIHLDRVGLEKIRNADACRRMLLNTAGQLILVKPLTMSGQPAHPHQFWPQLQNQLNNCSVETRQRIVTTTGGIFSQSHPIIAGRQLQLKSIELIKPPAPRRNWKIANNLIESPKQESFTSMDSILRCPFAWVLSYPAKIRPGTLLDVPSDDRLIGNLAHALAALLFTEKTIWIESEAANRAGEIFDELVPAIAAPLLLPERVLDLKRARLAIRQSMSVLARLLNYGKLRVIACEAARTAPFLNSTFVGSLDLLCQSTNGKTVVIDLKWSRSDVHRKKELAEGKCLQLAAYSWLATAAISEITEAIPVGATRSVQHPSLASSAMGPCFTSLCVAQEQPSAGYYMLRQSRLLHSDATPFPAATQIPGSDLAKVWLSAVKAYKTKLDSLKAGSVVAEGVAEEHPANNQEKSRDLLVLEPLCKLCSFGNLCGKRELFC